MHFIYFICSRIGKLFCIISICVRREGIWNPKHWTHLDLKAYVLCLVVQSLTAVRQAALSMGILQARILEWVAKPFSKGSSQPRDQTQVSHIAGRFFYLRSHQGHFWWLMTKFNCLERFTLPGCLSRPSECRMLFQMSFHPLKRLNGQWFMSHSQWQTSISS